MTDEARRGQVSQDAASIYEEFFVTALFREPAKHIARDVGLRAGQRVLDVACGTGVLARESAALLGPNASVVGLDRNEGMLALANRKAPGIDWRLGDAAKLSFEDHEFDVVLSQFGLMFFDDRNAALKEAWRVLRPGGTLAIAVWDALESSPGYAEMTALLHRLFGQKASDAMRAPFSLGDPNELGALFDAAGIADIDLSTVRFEARFPSLEAWVHTDIRGWTLSDMIDDDELDTLTRTARAELSEFVQEDGSVAFDAPAHIVKANKT